MRISVNLATRPYVELRPFFIRLRVLMGVLVAVGLGAILAAHLLQKRLDLAQAQMDRLHNKMVAARQEKLHNEQRMRQPANAAVLDRAHFLNALFLRKSFSWTAVMMDLERVLPIGVQVTSIEPQVSANGDVIIRLRVSGERDRAVELVRNLERSRRFLQPRLMGESTQARQGTPQANAAAANGAPAAVEFEILANYNPLPAGEPYAKSAQVEKTAASAPARMRPHQSGRQGVVLRPYSATHPHAVGPAAQKTRPRIRVTNPAGGMR
jgi:type IV pilus assembly protein PilN